MAGLPEVTLVGRLARDPELRFATSGTAVCSFTVVCSDRRKNDATNEWEDVTPTFFRCTAFGDLGENCAESLHRGDLVVAFGKLSERKWTTREGEERTSHQEVRVEEIGPSLRWKTARVEDSQPSKPQPSKPREAAPEPNW